MFQQLCQPDCLRQDVIFTSRTKVMTRSTAKLIEIISKAVDLVRRVVAGVNNNTFHFSFFSDSNIRLRSYGIPLANL